jgi:nucleotide-binding universal stress UspA family protein
MPANAPAVRLELAVRLAGQHGARLIGVFGQRAAAQRVGVVATWPSAEYVAARDASKAAFAKATAGLARAEWIDVNRGSDAEVLRQVTNHGAPFRPGHPRPARAWRQHPAARGLRHGGDRRLRRPVLVVPYAGDFPAIGKRPMIAWNDAREAAHALNDALPLLAPARTPGCCPSPRRHEDADASCARRAPPRRPRRQGQAEVLVVQDFGIMDLLLNRVSDRSADLLVMGAHGQIGFPFVSRGAGTRYILQHMTVPVLMSS